MLVVCGVLRFPSEDIALVRDAVGSIMERSRQDEGCIEYWWAEDLETAGSFRFFECWETEAHFAAHLDKPYEQDFNDNILPRITGAQAFRYEVTSRKPEVR